MGLALETERDLDGDALRALLSRVAAGDRDAFQRLYRATSGKIFGIVVRILGRTALAEDVTQDVYASIWARAGAYDPTRGSAMAWLSVTARNRAIDEIRKNRQVHVELQDDVLPGPSTDPLGEREAQEARSRLLSCLAHLPTERRDAVLLAYYRGLSREDLARRFGKPVPTIKTWLRRSLLQLRACMSP